MMKTYLLLFFSTLLLLFTLPKNGSVGGLAGTERAELKKTCSHKRLGKAACTRKCLKHQSPSGQQNAANLATDCSQQVYAIVATLPSDLLFTFPLQRATILPAPRKHLAPDLEYEPEPPRLS